MARPERQGPPATNRRPRNVTAGDSHILRPTGCPCGHLDDVCVTERPAPTGSHCPCSGLGIEHLRRPWALRWHLAGHPEWRAA